MIPSRPLSGAELIIHRNEAAIAARTNPWDLGTIGCCALLKTEALRGAIAAGGFAVQGHVLTCKALGGKEDRRDKPKQLFDRG